MTIIPRDSTLALRVGNQTYVLHPESANAFFAMERDKVNRLVVYENGAIAEEDELLK
jgi:hypothetical protein